MLMIDKDMFLFVIVAKIEGGGVAYYAPCPILKSAEKS